MYTSFPLELQFDIEEATPATETERRSSLKYYLAPKVRSDPLLPAPLPANYEARSTAEARLINGKLFAELIENVGIQTHKAKLCLAYNGLHIHGMRISNACQVLDIHSNSSCFDYYRCNDVLALGINLYSMPKVLRDMSKDDILSLIRDEDRLLLRLKNPSQDEISVRGTFCLDG
jgi:hypothetical protein